MSETTNTPLPQLIRPGFFRYLTKPIKVSEFMETLNEALEYSEKQLARKCDAERKP